MMISADVVIWSGAIVVGLACIAGAITAVLTMTRWLAVIVTAIILVGFAFKPETQVWFTATLLGLLAIIYLPLLVGAWVWRRVSRSRPALLAEIVPTSAVAMAHCHFADEEAGGSANQQAIAARDACEQDERIAQARDLERQGAFSLWSRP